MIGGAFAGIGVIPSAFTDVQKANLWPEKHLDDLAIDARGQALERAFLAASREMRDLGLNGSPVDSRRVDELLFQMEDNRKKFKAEINQYPRSRAARIFVELSEKLARIVAENPELAWERGQLRALERGIGEDLAALNARLDAGTREHILDGLPGYSGKIFAGMTLSLVVLIIFTSVVTAGVFSYTKIDCRIEYKKMRNEGLARFYEKVYMELGGSDEEGRKKMIERYHNDFIGF